MLHPTQNRPPRAQAIKDRREHREWRSSCGNCHIRLLSVANKSFPNFSGAMATNTGATYLPGAPTQAA